MNQAGARRCANTAYLELSDIQPSERIAVKGPSTNASWSR
jgi:hypothetical protein